MLDKWAMYTTSIRPVRPRSSLTAASSARLAGADPSYPTTRHRSLTDGAEVFTTEGYAATVSFTRAELKAFTGATLPDLIADGVRLLFTGINPGLRSVAVQGHFAPRGNRFYPALLRAGITEHLIDASAGMSAVDRAYLLDRGIGITSLVARATASADELGPAELIEGARALAERVRRFRPRAVAILGVTAYRAAFASPRASLGRQPADLAGSQLWVVPNPSGRNAHASLDALAAAYREVALAAGVVDPGLKVDPVRRNTPNQPRSPNQPQ
jgi:TDG/mug DNA glycosylase family protein